MKHPELLILLVPFTVAAVVVLCYRGLQSDLDKRVALIETGTNVYSLTADCHYTSGVARADSRNYAEGINDALDTFLLLSLEQRLMNTNRSYDEMAEIVCERMRVKRTELGKPK